MKNFTSFLTACGFCLLSGSMMAAIPHGSIIQKDVPMHAENNPSVVQAITINYKVVTMDGKSWGWTRVNGGAAIGGAPYSSQLRYWEKVGNGFTKKTENNLVNRVATDKSVAYGFTKMAIPDPVQISIFQDCSGFNESPQIDYLPTALNSADALDKQAPVLTGCEVDPQEVTAKLTFTGGSDNSGDFFYIVEDADHGIKEVSFMDDILLSDLTANTSYNLKITPVDFSGNEGTPITKSFTTAGLVQITSGIVKDIRFVLVSTGTQLEYFCTPVDPSQTLRDVSLKITPAGGTQKEYKPTNFVAGSPYGYIKITDSAIANKLLKLKVGYFIYVEGDPIWENYVTDQELITDGKYAGKPIMHMMGQGPDAGDQEAVKPLLTKFEITEQTTEYIKLNIEGSDNSGDVYYTITGGSAPINVFVTGEYKFVNFENGKAYDLKVRAKDLSGNVSTNELGVKFKTQKQRGFYQDGMILGQGGNPNDQSIKLLLDYNAQNILKVTLTTKEPSISTNNKKLYTARIEMDGNNRVFETSTDSLSASYTYPDPIPVGEAHMWRVVWVWQNDKGGAGATHWTNDKYYVGGDSGQADTEGPTAPVLSAKLSVVTWPACADVLSGVKFYEVTTDDVLVPVIINDLGEETFSYTAPVSSKSATVTAVDFLGNRSQSSTVNNIASSVDKITDAQVVIYNNNSVLEISGIDAVEIILSDMNGREIARVNNTNTLDATGVSSGIYIVKVVSESGYAIRKVSIK